MATFRFELNNKPTRNNKYAVLLCVSANGIRKRIKTNIEVSRKSDWNPTPKGDHWIRTSEPLHKKLNLELTDIINKAKDTYKELGKKGQASSNNVVSTMDKSECQIFSFIQFAENFAQRTIEAGDYRTYTKYITFLNKLKFFINGVKPENIPSLPKRGKEFEDYLGKMKKDLLFSDITLSFLNRFKSYLKKIPNAKNPELTLHQNTISKQFDNFKSLYNKGITEYKEYGLIIENNPFNDFECETIGTNKEKLTWEEIESIKTLDLEENSLIWHTRNCFMLAFYCAGMRAGDLIQLRGTNIVCENGSWRICYRMDKTTTTKDILLLPEALEIIKKYVDLNQLTSEYIFPLLDNKAAYAKAIT